MTGSRLLADTNAVVPLLNGDSDARTFFDSIDTIVLCPPVYGELVFGALKAERSAENLLTLAGLLRSCDFLDINADTSEVYARLKLELKRKGKPIPENDLWIAALSIQSALPLLTFDAHFSEIEGLDLRQW